jgi:glutamate-1-semialdehyde 2,1-aminomutase
VGKIVGGGMPVGAYLAPADLMDRVAPLGPVYQAGTLSGNPVGMAAGVATLDVLARPGTYEQLNALGLHLQQSWNKAFADAGVAAGVARVGSVAWLCLAAGPVPRAFHRIEAGCAERYAQLHVALMAQGVWMAPSAYEVAFVSTAHTTADIDRAAAALSSALSRRPSGSTA